jgi:outer membrane lipoprotein-sorting protein
MPRKLLPALLFAFGLLASLVAQTPLGAEIAQKHAERYGGRAKLEKLKSYRAEGRTYLGDKETTFMLWAARPDKLRIETFSLKRRLVQATDGTTVWQSSSDFNDGAATELTGGEARELAHDADFDGVLVDYQEKGWSVDFAGQEDVEGRAAFKLLVMGKREEVFFVWVDAISHEVVKRTSYRVSSGQRFAVDTYFKDFRKVAGDVMLPHRIEARVGARALHTTVFEKVEANPRKLPVSLFAPPEELVKKRTEDREQRTDPPAPGFGEARDGERPLDAL